jgi:hypothetical protein
MIRIFIITTFCKDARGKSVKNDNFGAIAQTKNYPNPTNQATPLLDEIERQCYSWDIVGKY